MDPRVSPAPAPAQPPQDFPQPPPNSFDSTAAGYPFSPVQYGGGSDPLPAKRRRGRPRKYSPDSSALALATSPHVADSTPSMGPTGGTPSLETQAKRRGRPPGSGKKQTNAMGSFGVGFTPHVIMVEAGEDIAAKILDFSQQGLRAVCILSANGAVSDVTLRQPSISGGTMTYEGQYEIISLSGSYLLSEGNGSSRTGGLSVSFAGPDGHVLGGRIAGVLKAAVPVQVIGGSFLADGKKPKTGPSSPPPTIMQSFGEPVVAASPPSQAHSSESGEENGNTKFNQRQVFFNNNKNNNNNNSNAPQAFHGMHMHPNMMWSNPNAHVLPQ